MWENLYMISGGKRTDLYKKAERRARRDEDAKYGGHTLDGRPVNWVFVGIRKIIQFQDRPAEGVEVTFNTFEVKDKKSLDLLANGYSVQLEYVGDDPPPPRSQRKTLVKKAKTKGAKKRRGP